MVILDVPHAFYRKIPEITAYPLGNYEIWPIAVIVSIISISL